jgi:hypothetical protein
MASFSDVQFSSFLVYPSKSAFPDASADKFRERVLSIKNDRTLPDTSPPKPAVEYTARAIGKYREKSDVLQQCFSGDLIAVPVPRSRLQKPGSLWPAHRICEELQRVGLVTQIAPMLHRFREVRPSHKSSSGGDRASADEHYASIEVLAELALGSQSAEILLVDDLVTRGSTFLACQALLHEAVPFAKIRAFAVARTVNTVRPVSILEPVAGTCSLASGQPIRFP